MCGVVGYAPGNTAHPDAATAFVRLFEQSIIRGLHAFGIAQPLGREAFEVHRSRTLADVTRVFNPLLPAIAHARYSTSGDWMVKANNQPLVVGDMALAFNGVIDMGTKEEFELRYQVKCEADNDGEIFLRKCQQGESPSKFINKIEGSFAATWLKGGQLYAGRNARRPLWGCEAYGAVWFASTRDIFRRAGFPVERALSLDAGAVVAV